MRHFSIKYFIEQAANFLSYLGNKELLNDPDQINTALSYLQFVYVRVNTINNEQENKIKRLMKTCLNELDMRIELTLMYLKNEFNLH
jgi:hypothetical protein